MGDAERGTLHVILTKGDDSAFRVSNSALDHLATASQVAGHVTSSAAWYSEAEAGHVDTRIAATAVTAQVHSLTPALLSAGESSPASSTFPGLRSPVLPRRRPTDL